MQRGGRSADDGKRFYSDGRCVAAWSENSVGPGGGVHARFSLDRRPADDRKRFYSDGRCVVTQNENKIRVRVTGHTRSQREGSRRSHFHFPLGVFIRLRLQRMIRTRCVNFPALSGSLGGTFWVFHFEKKLCVGAVAGSAFTAMYVVFRRGANMG